MADAVEIWVAHLHASGAILTAPLVVEPADKHAAGVVEKASKKFSLTDSSGLLQLFRLAGTVVGEPSSDELNRATKVNKTVPVSDRTVFYDGAWFRLDVIGTTSAPQAGE
jgi:hypothetical protein